MLGAVLGLARAERPELPWESTAVGTGPGSETAVLWVHRRRVSSTIWGPSHGGGPLHVQGALQRPVPEPARVGGARHSAVPRASQPLCEALALHHALSWVWHMCRVRGPFLSHESSGSSGGDQQETVEWGSQGQGQS